MSYEERQGRRHRAIELHIEKLVLNGFQLGDRYRIGDAVQHELSRLLTEQGIALTFAQSISINCLNAGTFSMSSGMSALDKGHQMAEAVYRAFERADNGTRLNGARNQNNGDSDNSHGNR